MTQSPQEKLAALAEKWRKNARELGRNGDPNGVWNDTLNRCANELTTLLSEHGGGGGANHAGYLVDGKDFYYADFPRSEWSKHQSVVPLYLHPPTPSAPATLESEVLDFITAVPGDRCHRMLVERGWKPPSAPVGVEERVRGVIALLRQPEPDNGEKRTEHDEGYEQASSEIADMLERILSGVSAPVGVDPSKMLRGKVLKGAFGIATIEVDCADLGPNTIGDGHEILIHNLTKNPLTPPAAAPRGERKVGCEGSDGLLRVHKESEACDVCSPAASEDGLHPDWQACTTLEELADGLAGNALAGYQAAMHKDAMDCLIRAQQLAASGQGVDWRWHYRFQTLMRLMDNGLDRPAAERAADADVASLERATAATQEKGNG